MKINTLLTSMACLLLLGLTSTAYADSVIARDEPLLAAYENNDRVFIRLQIGDVVSYFHQREIGEALVEKDFIRYQFRTDTGELIEHTVQWRDDLPERLGKVISQWDAESQVPGVVEFSELYIISPLSHVFPLTPTPTNPCWVVRSTDWDGLPVVTIIDAVTGKHLGHGVPPPSIGWAFSGPEWFDPCYSEWYWWYVKARESFAAMGYAAVSDKWPDKATIQSYVQSDEMAMFYETAHGNSYYFQSGCSNGNDAENTYSSDIEAWLTGYSTVPFVFLASCDAMCDFGDGTFSYEFRKGMSRDTAAVGYCYMGYPVCHTCWTQSVDWQDELFAWMALGYTVGEAFDQAMLAYPACMENYDCIRIAGDTGMRFVPIVTRSLCGEVYDGQLGPLTLNDRDYYVRCDLSVPGGQTLTVEPQVTVALMNDATLTAAGTLNADGTTGEIRIVREHDDSRGIKLNGELRLSNGGRIRVHE